MLLNKELSEKAAVGFEPTITDLQSVALVHLAMPPKKSSLLRWNKLISASSRRQRPNRGARIWSKPSLSRPDNATSGSVEQPAETAAIYPSRLATRGDRT